MTYRIYPSIGIARLGNHPSQFYIGPEIPDVPGFDIDAQGNETPIVHYKVGNDQIKRQAARFRLFDVPSDGGAPREAQLPAGAIVEWTVHLVNKKGAIVRPNGPPPDPQRPQLADNSAPLLIDPGPRLVSGANGGAVKFDTGEFKNRRVPLGELRTDGKQNLLVLGGFGFSSSPTNERLQSFYTNLGWHDDTSDGPVTARVRLPDGTTIDDTAPAWVIVAPPHFAPEIQGVVTLYDIMAQVGNASLGVPRPVQVSFTKDVFPLLLRTRRLRWVNGSSNWSSVSEDWQALANDSAAAADLRSQNAGFVRGTEGVLSEVFLTDLQNFVLDEWGAGRFQSDWAGIPQPGTTVTAEGMTRVALQFAVGQGFYPGIEAGIIAKDPTLYLNPFEFRLDHTQAKPGDLTALMALPWQADFTACGRNWWPSQRPNDTFPSATSTNRVEWSRGINDYLAMVNNFPELAFVTAQKDAAGNVVFAEDQRAPGIAIA
jgi:hypothetical protein